jgi:hypothetical protein
MRMTTDTLRIVIDRNGRRGSDRKEKEKWNFVNANDERGQCLQASQGDNTRILCLTTLVRWSRFDHNLTIEAQTPEINRGTGQEGPTSLPGALRLTIRQATILGIRNTLLRQAGRLTVVILLMARRQQKDTHNRHIPRTSRHNPISTLSTKDQGTRGTIPQIDNA